MPRSYTAGSIIALPRLDALTIGRLIEQLLTAAAAEKKLPVSLVEARDEMVEANDALQAELMKRQAGEGEESPQVRAADIVEDNSFRAVVAFLRALAMLPAERHPESEKAAEILDTVFSDGLGFIILKPEKEWKEAEVRLGLLDSRGFNATIEEMGGKPFLDELAFAHAQYGEVLGIKAIKEGQTPPAIRATFDDAVEAVRTYVLRVTANISKKNPASAELAERLLKPLTEWKDDKPKAAKGAKAAPPAADAKAKKDEAPADAKTKKDSAPAEPAGS